VISFSIMKQARGAAKATIKFKNLMRGTTIENTYTDRVEFRNGLDRKEGGAAYFYGRST
jgi:translation elongation factor P/translation initiation factor 5A